MGRPLKGPRLVKGIYCAVYTWRDASGKQHSRKTSLRTKDKATALSRWPTAYSSLKAKAIGNQGSSTAPTPIKPDDLVTEWKLDEQGNPTDESFSTPANAIYEPEDFELTWEQALEIHNERKEAKTGRPLAAATIEMIQGACKGVPAPGSVQVSDVRTYVDKLQGQGLAPKTISKKVKMLGAVTQTLIKGAYLPAEAINPWHRVDVSAKSQKHHREATKEEIAALCANGHPLLMLQLYLGLRVGELVSRDPSHLKEGWLNICPTSSGWRPKSESSERELPVPDTSKGALPGRMPHATTLNAQLKKITGTDLTTHGLRGAWRTASREAQLPTEMAEYLMGHAHPQQELISAYGSFSRQSKLEAMQKVWLIINKWCNEP